MSKSVIYFLLCIDCCVYAQQSLVTVYLPTLLCFVLSISAYMWDAVIIIIFSLINVVKIAFC